MEVVQQAMAVIGGAIGVLTALLTLYAKYLDVKKANQDRAGVEDLTAAPVRTTAPVTAGPPDVPPVAPVTYAHPAPDRVAIERARELVRAPAMALMIAGGLSLVANLGTAVFGYVDEFVTPLSTQTQEREALEAARKADAGALPEPAGTARLDSPQAIALMSAFTLLSFALASAIAVWAGYGMLRLKSYWLSVAGSVAVMPGACMCCFAGLPVGIWSLTILFRPDVASAFR